MVAMGVGPDRWILIGAADAGTVPPSEVLQVLAQEDHAVACMTDGMSLFTISGTDAATVLAKGTSIDLHRRVFPCGETRRTLFAGVPLTIHRPDETDNTFQLIVECSYEHYFMTWLRTASETCSLMFDASMVDTEAK